MLTKLTLGAAIVATAALLTPVSAAPPLSQSLAATPQQAREGAVEQASWRHRRWHHRHHRHCRRVWHWTPYRGWHWHTTCHWH
jgi:hypothetical protein